MQYRDLFISIVVTNNNTFTNIRATGSVPYPTKLSDFNELAKYAIENLNKDRRIKINHSDPNNITILNSMYISESYEK